MISTLRVYRYEFPIEDEFSLMLPRNAEILHVDVQAVQFGSKTHYRPSFWAMVDPEAATEKRRFRVAGTGHEIDPTHRYTDVRYVKTFLIEGGRLVFHLFEVWLNTKARIMAAKVE